MWRILLHTLKLIESKKHKPDRNDYGPEPESKRKRKQEWWEWIEKKLIVGSSSVGQMDFAVCTLPFQPSFITCHYFLFRTLMKVSRKNSLLSNDV